MKCAEAVRGQFFRHAVNRMSKNTRLEAMTARLQEKHKILRIVCFYFLTKIHDIASG
ncbi:MAG: hypothetical protein RLY87_2118 [Chloroflexota bacterium]